MAPLLATQGAGSGRSFGILRNQRFSILSDMYWSLASTTSPGANSVTFSSIPGTYQHLEIRAFARDGNASTSVGELLIRFNGDTGSNYSNHQIYSRPAGGYTDSKNGYGAASGTSAPCGYFAYGGNTANDFAVTNIKIFDYSNTNKFKSFNSYSSFADTGNNQRHQSGFLSGTWKNNAAITSITILKGSSENFATGTTFALYGIKAA